MALHDYLVSEVRLDHSDGHITRREALRLLGLLGVAGSTAAMWLETDAAAAATKTTKKTTPTTKKKTATTKKPVAASSIAPNPQAVSARPIRFAGPAGELRASFCAAVAHKILTVPGVDHAFFNDTGARYNKPQAEATYKTVVEWFETYVR